MVPEKDHTENREGVVPEHDHEKDEWCRNRTTEKEDKKEKKRRKCGAGAGPHSRRRSGAGIGPRSRS